jgi:hypothetical protein
MKYVKILQQYCVFLALRALIGVLDPCTPLREDLKQDSE